MSSLLTVVVPAYNAEKYLQEALDSLYQQEFKEFEILVVDDGSTDGTGELLAKQTDRRLRFVRRKNSSASGVRQWALENSSSEFMAFLDSDDLAHPARLGSQLKLFQEDHSLVLVGSSLELIGEDGRILGYREYPLFDGEIRRCLPIENPFAQSAVMVRRAAALAAGGYRVDEGDGAEDYDLWLRLARVGKMRNASQFWTRYRFHPGQFKASRTRLQLRTTLKVRKRAVIEYGYPLTFRYLFTFLAQILLLLLPSHWVYALFIKRTVRGSGLVR